MSKESGNLKQVSVRCANPDEMKLELTVSLSVGHWREVLKRINGVSYYWALDDFLEAVRDGIRQIENRSVVSLEPPSDTPAAPPAGLAP